MRLSCAPSRCSASNHQQARRHADGNQDESDAGQRRREQKSDRHLKNSEHQRGEKLHEKICRAGDALDVGAQKIGHAGMLQPRHNRPGRGCQPRGDAGTHLRDIAHLQARLRDLAAGGDQGP